MLQEIPSRLAELLGVPPGKVRVEREPAAKRERALEADLLVSVGGLKFVVEMKGSGSTAAVAMAVRQAGLFGGQAKGKIVPLVVVPYMGEVGRRLCKEGGVCWMDLSGNAHLTGPGLRVSIEGKPNRFKRPGRPRNVFAPKSSRIVRWLLMKSDRAFTQRELARATGLGEGFTSRIVRTLEEQSLVVRDTDGAVRVADYAVLLDAWWEAYDFSRHHIVRGHVAARSSNEILHRLADKLMRSDIEYAATGLAGAWLLNQFAGFRLVVLYVDQIPSAEASLEMGFREEQQGENVWLVAPNDEGVFHGARERDSIRCVHPVQAYLDLKDHPERSAEAAEQLRSTLLNKGNHA